MCLRHAEENCNRAKTFKKVPADDEDAVDVESQRVLRILKSWALIPIFEDSKESHMREPYLDTPLEECEGEDELDAAGFAMGMMLLGGDEDVHLHPLADAPAAPPPPGSPGDEVGPADSPGDDARPEAGPPRVHRNHCRLLHAMRPGPIMDRTRATTQAARILEVGCENII